MTWATSELILVLLDLSFLDNTAFVLQQQPTSMGEILEAARFAETTGIAGAGAGGGDWSELMDEVRASRSEVQQLATRVNRLTTNVVQSRSPTPDRRAASRTPPRQVTFARSPDRREPRPQETTLPRSNALILADER